MWTIFMPGSPASTAAISLRALQVEEHERQIGGRDPADAAGLAERLRADAVSETDHRDRYQQNAPKVEAGLDVVPKVIE